jgi:hypothetical protein
MKWAIFVYAFGVDDEEEAMHYERQSIEIIIGLLESAGASDIPDEPIEVNRYNFEPVILNREIRVREDDNNYNPRNTGGRHKKQTKKQTKKQGKKRRPVTRKKRKF